MNYNYVIITPVRNEEKFIEHTILSVVNQSIWPLEWVIVNDGSIDDTGAIINKYAESYKWIRPVHRKDRGYRKSGGGVVNAFYAGYENLSNKNWNFIVKLDGDLLFSRNYFKLCLENFARDPNLGIGGGTIYNYIADDIIPENNPAFHVRGATKIYRKSFWDRSGGLIPAPGWDTLDEVKANMLGFSTRSFSDIPIFQLKITGSADGVWRNAIKNGKGSYISGYHPLFYVSKCLKRLIERPFVSNHLD